jgi:phenylpropionate dioxygenase-like ring-hydroxylating dioxygenase large terminal subunit
LVYHPLQIVDLFIKGQVGCRYHGWSYDTPGNLIKAPGFDDVLSFDKSAEWDVQTKTYTARQGLIFVNFDASPDSISFEEYYKGLEDECDDVDFSEFEYIESWELDGQFNWKTLSMYIRNVSLGLTRLVDGYHECHHCPTADPSFSKAIKGHVV